MKKLSLLALVVAFGYAAAFAADNTEASNASVEMNTSKLEMTTIPVPVPSVGLADKSDWCGFFNVKKEYKAEALACAIKGVGDSLGQCLVNNNVITNKPDTWEAFKAMMKKGDYYCPGTYANAVEKYGSDNKRDLGYGNSYKFQQTFDVPVTYLSVATCKSDLYALMDALENHGVTVDEAGINVSAGYSPTYTMHLSVKTSKNVEFAFGKGYANQDRANQAINDKGNYLKGQGNVIVWKNFVTNSQSGEVSFIIVYLAN